MTDNKNKNILVMTNYEHYHLFWSSRENEIKRYVKDVLFYFHEPYPNQLQLLFEAPEFYPLLIIDWDGLPAHCIPGITPEQQLTNIIHSFKNRASATAIWAVSSYEPNPLIKTKFQSINLPYHGPNRWFLKSGDFWTVLGNFINPRRN